MQAIVTKYFGPGNVRGSRIKATASAGSITIAYDQSLNLERNHVAAAKALAEKFGWHGRFIGGGLPNGTGEVFVCDDARCSPAFTIERKD